jgi:hypothetical protein
MKHEDVAAIAFIILFAALMYCLVQFVVGLS